MSLLSPLMNGLRTKPFTDSEYLRVGADILNWMQEEQSERDRHARLAMLENPGLVVSRDGIGQLGPEWLPYEDPDNSGYLLVGDAGAYGYQSFVDASGYLVVSATQLTPTTQWTAPLTSTIQIPTDSTWRTLVVRKAYTRYAPGTITFTNGSANISGTGTDLTRFGASTTNGLAQGTVVRVDTADSAWLAGTYNLATVTSTTSGTLTATAGASGTTPFTVAGSYQGAGPATEADTDIYQRLVPEFELVTQTTSPTAGDLILADVWSDGGDIKIRDRRQANMLCYRSGVTGAHWIPALRPNFAIDTTSAFTGLTQQEWQISNASNEEGDTALAWRGYGISGGGQLLGLVVRVTTGVLDAISYEPNSGVGGEGTRTTLTTVVAGGVNSTPALLHVQTGSRCTGSTEEHTHLAVYITSGKLFCKISVDNGSNWTGGVSAIWDPTSIDANDTVSDPCIVELRNGRIRVCCVYYDDSASQYGIRSIYSDDIGASWTTNSDAGYTHRSGSANVRRNPTMAQDRRNGRIWLAYEEESSGVATVRVGNDADETGQSPFLPTIAVGQAMDDSTPSDQCQPVLWVGPNGIAVLVYVDRLTGASGFLDLRYSVIGEPFPRTGETEASTLRELYNRHIQRLTNAATHGSDISAATDQVRPAICQGPTGVLYILYTEPGPSGGGPVDLYMLKVMDVVGMPLAAGLLS